MLLYFMVHLICYHFWSIGCYLLIKVSKCYNFRVLSFMLSFGVIIYFLLSFNVIIFYVIIWCYFLVLSFILCYHLMLSFLKVCKYYHFCVIIFPCTGCVLSFMLSFMLSFNVIIFCYHFPLFSFSWKRDTLPNYPVCL